MACHRKKPGRSFGPLSLRQIRWRESQLGSAALWIRTLRGILLVIFWLHIPLSLVWTLVTFNDSLRLSGMRYSALLFRLARPTELYREEADVKMGCIRSKTDSRLLDVAGESRLMINALNWTEMNCSHCPLGWPFKSYNVLSLHVMTIP